MLDRIPTPGQEGRVLVTPEDGSAPFYAKIQMADNPTQEGTPLAKSSLLTDEIAIAFGLTSRAVPNDVFRVLFEFCSNVGNEYVWAKASTRDVAIASATTANVYAAWEYDSTLMVTLQYADEVAVENGAVVLVNPKTFSQSMPYNDTSALSFLAGKYIIAPDNDGNQLGRAGKIYRVNTTTYGGGGTAYYIVFSNANEVVVAPKETVLGYVNSSDPNAYPPAEDDGYTYSFLGQLGGAARIATGSYIGTGTYGESNPNSLTFDFAPKFIAMFNHLGNIYKIGDDVLAGNTDGLTTAYVSGALFGKLYANGSLYAKKSGDGKTIYWYHQSGSGNQLNDGTYRYIAIG